MASFPKWPTYPAAPPTPRKRLLRVGFVLAAAVALVALAGLAASVKNGLDRMDATPVPAYSELVAAARDVPYQALLSYPEKYRGELVRWPRATVIEVVSSNSFVVSTLPCGAGCRSDWIYVDGDHANRLSEDDVVELIGWSRGTAQFGFFPMPATTIPRMDAASIRVVIDN